MKALFPVAALAIFLAANACGEGLPTVKVAVVRFDRVMNANYDRARLLYASKDAIAAIQKANADVKSLYDEVVTTEDANRLNELNNKINFLRQKINILRQGAVDGNRDMQVPVREFIIKQYGDKYNMIINEPGLFDRCMAKKNVEVVDISDEAAEAFRKHIDQLSGEEPQTPAPAKPQPSPPGAMSP